MLITPLPGTNRQNLLQTMQHVRETVGNLYTASKDEAPQKLVKYLEWTINAGHLLGNQISSRDLNRLVFTEGRSQLLSGLDVLSTGFSTPITNGLLSFELQQRIVDFDAAIDALRGQINRWVGSASYIVFDTTVFIQHPTKLEELNLHDIFDAGRSPIHLLVPIVVVDELDRLKEASKAHVRWRARHTLSVLDQAFGETGRGTLQPKAPDRPEVTTEILMDPRGHSRLPNVDDEIVDRALSVEPLAARSVTLVTYDTGQSSRARFAGLDVLKLEEPVGEEPPADTPGASKGRRAAGRA